MKRHETDLRRPESDLKERKMKISWFRQTCAGQTHKHCDTLRAPDKAEKTKTLVGARVRGEHEQLSLVRDDP